MANLTIQNQELRTQLENITTQLTNLQNTLQQLTLKQNTNSNNNHSNINNKPIKPTPILKHDHAPPRVPKAINNQAPRVDMPVCSPNPTPPDTPNPHNNMHNYFTRSKVTKPAVHTDQANAVLNLETGKLEEYRQLRHGKDKVHWIHSFSNELGRLAQGIQDIKGTDCITFIYYKDIPKGQKIAYAHIICNIRPQKKETYHTCMTIGRNLLDYNGNTKTLTADLITLKLLLNSVLSIPKAKFMTIDIKNFYLETKLKNNQYMFLPAELIPDEIMQAYNLHNKIHNSNLYMEINKGIYSLKEAGTLANQQL